MSTHLFSRATGLSLWLALALSLIPISAYAHGDKGGGKGACKADVEKFCGQVKRGEGRVLDCLKNNKSQLSTACQEKLPIWEKFQAMRQTCKADREKFCGQVKREDMRACMKENHSKLSTSCQAAIEELKAWKKSHQPKSSSNAPKTDLPPQNPVSGPPASL